MDSDSCDDIFSILEAFENVSDIGLLNAQHNNDNGKRLISEKSITSENYEGVEVAAAVTTPKSKKQKVVATSTTEEGVNKVSHINVERNRRKQMNDHLTVLRALMPCFYVKRGDQASIIGGVVDYITELQQILQSLESKKQRKLYSDHQVLSPRVSLISSPRPSPLSPRKPPLSPRIISSLPISPRTPSSPYKQRLMQATSPCSSTSSSAIDNVNELAANSKSAIADVEVKFSGANVLLKTVSPCIPGQTVKIISAIEDLSLEILHVNISTIDQTMLNSFTIKIGIECQLSAEELAYQIQQTFCSADISKP